MCNRGCIKSFQALISKLRLFEDGAEEFGQSDCAAAWLQV